MGMQSRCVRWGVVAMVALAVVSACSSTESTGGASGQPSGGGSSDPGGSGELGASDVGVTADTITVAYTYPDLGDLVKQGLVEDLAPSADAIQPLVDEVNARGGINGRKLVMRVTSWDPLKTPGSLLAACTEIAEDAANFAAFSSAFYGDAAVCLAADKGVPLLTTSGMAGALADEASENLFLFNMTFEEAQRSAVATLDRAGSLDGLKLGAVLRDEPGAVDSVEAGLRPALEDLGMELADVAVIAGGAEGDPASLQAAVQKFKGEGIDGVFLLANAVSISSAFVTQADLVGYEPQFFATDQSEVSTSILTKGVPPNSLDGALGVSFRRQEGAAAADDVSDADAACAALRAEVTPALAAPGTTPYNSFMATCNLFDVMVEGLKAAGPDLTRTGFVAALEGLGAFDLGSGGKGSFGPGKRVAPDEVRPVAYEPGCNCWAVTGPFVSFR